LDSQSLAPVATIDGNKIETERPDRVVTRNGYDGKKYQKRLTDEQLRDIISRRGGDVPESYQTIAKDIGCSKSTAWRQAKKYERQTKLCRKTTRSARVLSKKKIPRASQSLVFD
jgi:DNA invertase Pin-like site-specific DNA recombinase